MSFNIFSYVASIETSQSLAVRRRRNGLPRGYILGMRNGSSRRADRRDALEESPGSSRRSVAIDHRKPQSQWTRALPCWSMVLVVSFTTVASLGRLATAQQTTEPPSEIVDDLLDLLNQPPSPDPATPAENADLPATSNALSTGPLAQLNAVRRGMTQAAKLLEQGNTGDETHRVHAAIVRQLDELIASMESSTTRESQSNSTAQSSSSTSAESSSNSNATPSEGGSQASSTTPAAESASASNLSSQPGQSGVAPRTVVELTDPQSLQQSVWGQLPPRVRQQMQSRMVEQFLPSYRAEIESYFQALLNDSSPTAGNGPAGGR